MPKTTIASLPPEKFRDLPYSVMGHTIPINRRSKLRCEFCNKQLAMGNPPRAPDGGIEIKCPRCGRPVRFMRAE